ncbi:DUF6491 family protein [Frateuria hangzhouensis]|uniref:DUF6491 family protein n=1 Tax=Frateuria hangzhouensis TaxID=2995589 RepID=UPI002260E30F|nr:DUF6491 family protein [Frateuria sp. STR12]MCX7513877.1 DUF6491 family protein [Frateuria sp. STR12]
MKGLSSLLLIAAAGCTSAFAGNAPPARESLPYAQCIQIDKINEWHVLDARRALVRTGPHRYEVRLQADCPRLGIGVPGFLLRANESNKALGGSRICGEAGETVSARDQPPCAIAAVTLIDEARFDQLRKHAARHGSGAEP